MFTHVFQFYMLNSSFVLNVFIMPGKYVAQLRKARLTLGHQLSTINFQLPKIVELISMRRGSTFNFQLSTPVEEELMGTNNVCLF